MEVPKIQPKNGEKGKITGRIHKPSPVRCLSSLGRVPFTQEKYSQDWKRGKGITRTVDCPSAAVFVHTLQGRLRRTLSVNNRQHPNINSPHCHYCNLLCYPQGVQELHPRERHKASCTHHGPSPLFSSSIYLWTRTLYRGVEQRRKYSAVCQYLLFISIMSGIIIHK